MFTEIYKNINNFVSKIFKRNISGKTFAEEASRIERCVSAKIQDKYNFNPKNSPVDYAVMLLPITKTYRVKNERNNFRNRHNKKIIRYHLQDQYQSVYVVRT